MRFRHGERHDLPPHDDRRRQSKRTFRSKQTATDDLTRFLGAHQIGAFVAPSRTMRAEFAEVWLDGLERQGRRPSTLHGYRRDLERCVLARLGAMPLQDIRVSVIDTLSADLLRNGRQAGGGLSMRTEHHVHHALKLFDDAERKGLITRNVVRLSTHPSQTAARASAPEMSVRTPDELATFLRSIEGNRNDAMSRLAALTGMRRGGLVGLRGSDVDLARRRLIVNQSATVVDRVEVVTVPKTRRSRGVLDLDVATVATLQQHRTRQRERYLRVGVSATASDRVAVRPIPAPARDHSRAAHPSTGPRRGTLRSRCRRAHPRRPRHRARCVRRTRPFSPAWTTSSGRSSLLSAAGGRSAGATRSGCHRGDRSKRRFRARSWPHVGGLRPWFGA